MFLFSSFSIHSFGFYKANTALHEGAAFRDRKYPLLKTSYYPYSIPLLLLDFIHPGVARNFRNFPFSRGAREFIYSYLSTARLFHKRFPCLFALSFIFYKVNEIVPPPLFCQPFSLVFPRFFNFCRFCGSFSAIFAFPNKKLSTAHRLRITRFFILQAIPLAAFVYKKKCGNRSYRTKNANSDCRQTTLM